MGLRKFLTYSEVVEYVSENKTILKRLYIDSDMTARKVAENQNVFYDQNFQKALLRVCGKKGKGLGGLRQNSGNKKGVKFCTVCRKKFGNCIHTKKNK